MKSVKWTAIHQSQKAGTASGNWSKYNTGNVSINPRWLKLFKKFFREHVDEENEQWAYPNRRFTELPNDLILPSDHEQDNREKNKVSVWLFLDTSGSCYWLKDPFLKAYRSIPKNKFDIRLFSFDTRVEEVDQAGSQIYGGGGTCFAAIERKIVALTNNEEKKYPKIVMVFTDGCGTVVKPKFPDRWNWFLPDTPDTYVRQFIPAGSIIHRLRDFGVSYR
jgi:hypothetical protein